MKVKVKIEREFIARETNTEGTNAYVVALESGGLMEDPDIRYSSFQIIRAESEDDARIKFNELNNCEFFYGSVIGKVIE